MPGKHSTRSGNKRWERECTAVRFKDSWNLRGSGLATEAGQAQFLDGDCGSTAITYGIEERPDSPGRLV